jgi:apolipoprotein N-acyltransferase
MVLVVRTARRGWGWFLAWVALGVVWVLVVLGAFTIGIFVSPIAVGGTILLATRRHAGRRDRRGDLRPRCAAPVHRISEPARAGTICASSRNGQSCVDELNAWPWFAFGLALVALGAVVFVISGSRRQRVQDGP